MAEEEETMDAVEETPEDEVEEEKAVEDAANEEEEAGEDEAQGEEAENGGELADDEGQDGEVEAEGEEVNAEVDPEASVEEEPEVAPADIELQIRDEDHGRPLSSRSQKSVSFADDPPSSKPPGGGGGLGHFIRGMWASREMLDEETDATIVMKTTLRELIIYCVFLFVIVYMTFTPYTPDYYILRNGIEELFEQQAKVKNNKDFWDFAENELLDGLYSEELYNKGRKRGTVFKCPSTGDFATGPCPVPPTDRNMMYENRMLGVPRMRQLKVGETSCMHNVNPDFLSAIRKCFAPYAPEYEDKQTYTPEYRKYTDMSAWIYQSPEETGTGFYSGKVTEYSGGGYIQNLHYQKNVSDAMLKELKKNLWIDRGTRFLDIDFTVYNGNVNLFAVVKLYFEFPATGGIFARQDIEIIKLLKYAENTDYLLLSSELLFILFILYYVVEELFEIHEHGWAYFGVFGNLLDIVVIGTSIAQIVINWYMLYFVNLRLAQLMELPFAFADFSSLSALAKWANYLASFNIFVAWLKVFKYLSFNKTMNQLSGTLSKCSKELGGFTVMFSIIFFAFAELGYLLFGTQVGDYNSTINASYTLFRTILGDFNFVSLQTADSFFGPAFFLTYIFFVFFVLLNMFLAIINDTYGEVKAELKRAKPSFQMGDFFMVGVNNIKCSVGMQNRKLDVENALKMAAADDGFVTYSELRENLKHSNFSDVEIDLFFDMFKEDPEMADMIKNDSDEELMEEERAAHMANLEAELSSDEGGESDVESQLTESFMSRPMSGKEVRMARSARIRAAHEGKKPLDANRFYGLTERMTKMEATVGPILNKLDRILERIDDAKRFKQQKKSEMKTFIEALEENPDLDDAAKNLQIRDIASRMEYY